MTTLSRIPSPKSLYDQWIKDQGLTPKDIACMGLSLRMPEDILHIMKFHVGAPSVLIPYDVAGTPDYVRVRRLGVSDSKYKSPLGSSYCPVYLPPNFNGDWKDIKADPNSMVLIVEGEVKAYWGCKVGLPVVGIGGVDMIKRLFDGSWIWPGRTVQVVFDHDAGQEPGTYKRGVNEALGRLCAALIEHGAEVQVLHLGLAVDDPSRKYGLDDYLREFGPEGLGKLASTATAAPEWCSMLGQMLEESVFVAGTNHAHIYNLRNGSRKSPSDFHDTHIEKKRVTRGESGKPVVKYISRIWVEHPSRVTVDHYDLNPRLPFGVQGDIINLWEGYPVFHGSVPGVRQEWQTFMEGLFGEYWEWVGLWVGHLLNRPWERTTQAVMLLTMVQGIGKSLFGDIVRDLCGKHGLEGKASRMFGGFNSEMEAKTFIMVNELDVKFSAKEGQLNDLLTEEVVAIEQKGKDVISLPNLRRWYFTTNTSSPCRLSAGQRRVLVICPPRVMGDKDGPWGTWVREHVAKFRKSDAALSEIRSWFDDLWYKSGKGEGVWDSTMPVPETEAGHDAAEASMTTTQIVAQELYEWICAQEGGWSAAHPNVRRSAVKVFGELTALVKAHGGYVGQKTVKEDGVVKAYTIYDSCGKLERLVKPSSGSHNMVVESAEAKERAQKLALRHHEAQQLLGIGG